MPRAFLWKKWIVSRFFFPLAAALLCVSHTAFCGEDNPPDSPDSKTQTDKPFDVKPDPSLNPELVPATPVTPRPATFSDYIPLSSTFGLPLKPAFPIVENRISSVANQLVRDSANESVFATGSGPQFYAQTPASLVDTVPLLHTGPFAFRTQFSLENIFNDNYLGGSLNRRGTWLRNESAGFSAAYTPNRQTSINAYYTFIEHDYTTNVVRDYYDEIGGREHSGETFRRRRVDVQHQ